MFGFLKEKFEKLVGLIEEKFEKEETEKPKVLEKIVKKVREKRVEEKDLEPILKELEDGLIESDVAYEVAEKIKEELKKEVLGKEVKRGKEKEFVLENLKNTLIKILSVPKIDLEKLIERAKEEKRPALILFFGVNGVGKSLNLAKVAYFLKRKKYKPLLAAGDTFRAGSIQQLEEYAIKANVPVIKQKYGSDGCAVIFDARKAAEVRGYDVVLGDTSGRIHTNKDLMDELSKIVRVNKPDLKVLVLDSLTGSDVISQLEFFENAIGVDALIFSKVDINEKGGNILSVCYKFKKPVLFLGVGQEIDDIVEYEPKKIVEEMIGLNSNK
ncbi:MAG: signal recognition particle-docking protein FtsY [Candidatus Aenigmatarchaeota archaeon]